MPKREEGITEQPSDGTTGDRLKYNLVGLNQTSEGRRTGEVRQAATHSKVTRRHSSDRPPSASRDSSDTCRRVIDTKEHVGRWTDARSPFCDRRGG